MTYEVMYERNFSRNKRSEGKVEALKALLDHEIKMISKGLRESLVFSCYASSSDDEMGCYYCLKKNELIAYPNAYYYYNTTIDEKDAKKVCIVKGIESIRIYDNKLIIRGKENYKVTRSCSNGYTTEYRGALHDEKDPSRVFCLADITYVYRSKNDKEKEEE